MCSYCLQLLSAVTVWSAVIVCSFCLQLLSAVTVCSCCLCYCLQLLSEVIVCSYCLQLLSGLQLLSTVIVCSFCLQFQIRKSVVQIPAGEKGDFWNTAGTRAVFAKLFINPLTPKVKNKSIN